MKMLVDISRTSRNFLQKVKNGAPLSGEDGICAGMCITWITEALLEKYNASTCGINIKNQGFFFKSSFYAQSAFMKVDEKSIQKSINALNGQSKRLSSIKNLSYSLTYSAMDSNEVKNLLDNASLNIGKKPSGLMLCYTDAIRKYGHAIAIFFDKNKVYLFDPNFGVFSCGISTVSLDIKYLFKEMYPGNQLLLNRKFGHIRVM